MVEVTDGGEEVRVVPMLRPSAVRLRLDGAVGPMGWGMSYQLLPGDAMLCQLRVGEVEKGAVVAAARVGGAVATADAAFCAAAELFGLRAPFAEGVSAWLPCDPVTLEPLHPPMAEDLAVVDRSDEVAPAIAHPTVADVSIDSEAAPAGGQPLASSDAPMPKPEGQQMIDRLVERLKAEGQGLVAARLLVRHGGYGKDPEAARALYAELRALLKQNVSDADSRTAEVVER